MPNDADQFDFFVSYARKDNETGWITRFVEALIAEHKTFTAGRALKPFFDQHAITTGADWQLYLAHGIAHSRLFLAFISPNYFSSEWCRKEWRAWLDAEIAQHILTAGVRPIYIIEVPGLTGKGELPEQQLAEQLARLSTLTGPDKAKLLAETPPVVKHLRRRQLTHNQTYCDVHAFYDAGLDALRRDDLHRVLNDLAHDLDHHAALLAQADASRSTVPAYNKNFTGRLDELLALRERLIKDDRTGVIYGVHGLGGIGKSELAFAYAHAYASAYPGGRFLLRCEGETNLRDAILGQSDFTELFNISDEKRKQPDTYFAAVTACLRDRLEKLGHVLLVLDNVTDTGLLLHQQTKDLTALGPKLHLLATTRLVPPSSGKGNWLSLGQLPDDDAMDLLEKYRPFASDAERDAARRIVKRLGGFTLAVELVAAHLAAHPGVTCAQMADTIGLEDLENPAVLESGDTLRYDHDRRLSAVLAPTLATLSPAERRALEYAAFLPPDHVPLPWLRTLVVADFPEIGQPASLTNPWDDLWRHLEKLALFTRPETETTEPRLMRVHRLVQDLVKRDTGSQVDGLRQRITTHAKLRCQFLEEGWLDWVNRWEIAPLAALSQLMLSEEALEATKMANNVALLLQCVARFAEAESLLRCALAIDEKKSGPESSDASVSLTDLAMLLRATNRIAQAEPFQRRALAIDEQCYGPDHSQVATDLNNLALLLDAMDRTAEAESLARRALMIDEKVYGPKHPDVARDLNTIAWMLQMMNREAEAKPLQRRALAIDESIYGPEHPQVAIRLCRLGSLLHSLGQLAEAEPLMRRSLTIYEKVYGLQHPKVAIDLRALALLLNDLTRLTEAEELMRRALAIDEQHFGLQSPTVAGDLRILGLSLKLARQFPQAEDLYRRALAIDEKHYDGDGSSVATDLNNLASLCQDTGRREEAGSYYRRALDIVLRYKVANGHDHSNLRKFVMNYATLLRDMGCSPREVRAQLNDVGRPFSMQLGELLN